MRVLFLNPSGRLGGAETSLLGLLKSLRSNEPGWSLYLVVGEQGELASLALSLGVEVLVVPLPASLGRIGEGNKKLFGGVLFEAWRYRTKLQAAITDIAPDIIHTNGFKMHLFGAWIRGNGAGGKIPVVCHLHDYVSSRAVAGRLMSASIKRFTTVVANSASVAADVMKLPVDHQRVTWIYNGVDTERFSPKAEPIDLDKLSGISPTDSSSIRVGLVATFAKWKGHETFLRAISLLPKNLNVQAYIIGGPIYQTGGSQFSMEQLRAIARQYGIASQVHFTGFIQNSPGALRALDIVVHASTEPEPFGMVIVEAMACGRAVIASLGGGAKEIVQVGITALGHAPGNARELAHRIEELTSNPKLRSQLGENGRTAVIRQFQTSAMARKFAAVYTQAAGIRQMPHVSPETVA